MRRKMRRKKKKRRKMMMNRENYIQCNNKCGVWILCNVIRWSVVNAGEMTIK